MAQADSHSNTRRMTARLYIGGALSVPNGQISLKWTHTADGRLVLHWTETGGPAVKVPTHQGFGTRIIERMIGQLKGKAHFDWYADGLVCEITLQA